MHRALCASVGLAALGILAASAQADTLTFTIENRTEATIESFYASPVGTKSWEEDLLGDSVLLPGERKVVSFVDHRDVCRYDLLFSFTAGSSLEDLQDTENLCELESYAVEE